MPEDDAAAARQPIYDAFNAEMKAMHESLPAGRCLSRLGDADPELVHELADLKKQVQFISIRKEDGEYAARFVQCFRRIGDDIETEDQMDELMEDLEHPERKKTKKKRKADDDDDDEDDEDDDEGGGFGFRMLNTRHSWMQVSMLEYGVEQALEAVKRKKWPEAYKHLLALHHVLMRDDHFLSDTESPEDTQAVFKSIGKAWEKLFAQPTSKWTTRPEDASAWKDHLRWFNQKLQGYEALFDEDGDDEDEDDEGSGEYRIPVKGVTV